jgi:hypothetical protein
MSSIPRIVRLGCYVFVLLGVLFGTTIMSAQASRIWVSGIGDDANPCSRTAPCMIFIGAISKTVNRGEIDFLVTEGGHVFIGIKSKAFDLQRNLGLDEYASDSQGVPTTAVTRYLPHPPVRVSFLTIFAQTDEASNKSLYTTSSLPSTSRGANFSIQLAPQNTNSELSHENLPVFGWFKSAPNLRLHGSLPDRTIGHRPGPTGDRRSVVDQGDRPGSALDHPPQNLKKPTSTNPSTQSASVSEPSFREILNPFDPSESTSKRVGLACRNTGAFEVLKISSQERRKTDVVRPTQEESRRTDIVKPSGTQRGTIDVFEQRKAASSTGQGGFFYRC